jgi:hypothetical protein
MKKHTACSPELRSLLDRSSTLRGQAAALIAEAERLEQQIVDKFHPAKVGAVVVANGYIYEGKDMVVGRRALVYSHDTEKAPYFMSWGCVRNKNGSLSMRRTSAAFNLDGTPLGGLRP